MNRHFRWFFSGWLLLSCAVFPLTTLAVLDNPTTFVAQQYRDFLSREGESQGITHWAGEITSGRVSRAQMVEVFFNSDEFQNNIAPITRLYLAYFNRIPDYPGLQFWIGEYLRGVSLITISQSFANSDEFRTTYGTLSDSAFVRQVYVNVLGRAPDPNGLNYWTAQIQAGMSRGEMMVGFSESAEYRQGRLNAVRVIMIYVGMLRRVPEQSGFDFWVNQLNNGVSVLALINGFLNAQEYASRFSGGSNRRPVASALSIQAPLTVPLVQLDLIGTDPDGDVLQFALISPDQGTGYREAYVNPQSGRFYTTLDGSGQTVTVNYHVSDGMEFSEPATITIQVAANVEEGFGLRDVDPQVYGRFGIYYPYGDLLGSPGAAPRLPPTVDLSPSFPTPGNQGRQGSCVGWATAYATKSYHEKVEIGWDLNRLDQVFSPAFIFNQIQNFNCTGSYIHEALEVFVNRGAATWSQMPYTDSQCTTQPSAAAVQQAAGFKSRRWARLQTVDDMKAALANRNPVIVALQVYENFQQLRGANAVYNSVSGRRLEGHAVTMTGYDDNRFGGAFRIINSWGTNWGDNGYFWVPYAAVNAVGLSQAYVLEDAANTVTPTPVDPTPRPTDLPNLSITGWNATYDARPGGSGRLQWRVTNTGTAVAPRGADVNLMLSVDRVITSGDLYVVYETISFDLAPGGSAFRDENNAIAFRFPDTLTDGEYYMALWVDDLDVVRESNENDNVSWGTNKIVFANQLADLEVQTWYADWDSSGNGLVYYVVANRGNGAAPGGWDVNLMLSRDRILGNSDDQYLFYETVTNPLAPGFFIEGGGQFSLRNVPPGVYYMAVWVDDLQQIAESNERNNVSWGWGTVTLGGFGGPAGAEPKASMTLEGLDQPVQHNYNGRPLPDRNLVMQKVRITTTPEGGRHLEYLPDPSALAASPEHFTQTNQARNPVIFPIVESFRMP